MDNGCHQYLGEWQMALFSTMTDLYSRAIKGWVMARHTTADLVCEALPMTFKNRDIGNDLIIHFDRGVPFLSNVYRNMLTDRNINRSMSRVANCWDNEAMETFFRRLKVELIYAETVISIIQAKSAIFE